MGASIPEAKPPLSDPWHGIIGDWAGMGDEAIDAFLEEVRRMRDEPGRDVLLGNEQ